MYLGHVLVELRFEFFGVAAFKVADETLPQSVGRGIRVLTVDELAVEEQRVAGHHVQAKLIFRARRPRPLHVREKLRRVRRFDRRQPQVMRTGHDHHPLNRERCHPASPTAPAKGPPSSRPGLRRSSALRSLP